MPGPAFASGSATSESAAARLETRLKHAQGILRMVEAEGANGITCDQATHQSCSARVHELGEQCGALRRAGVRRQTRSRRMAEVYVLADGLTAETALERYTAWCAASRGSTTARRSHRERAVIKAAREYVRLNTNEAGALSNALMNLINAAKALEES